MKYDIKDYVGKKIGSLTIVSDEPFYDNRGRTTYKCVCDCGNVLYRNLSVLVSCKRLFCRNCVSKGRHSERTKKVVVRNLDGEIIEKYCSISLCAEKYNTFPASISYNIRKKKIAFEKTFHYAGDPYNRDEYKPPKRTPPKKRIINHVVKYETMHSVICVTPCPFSKEPDPDKRPKVGSSSCMLCQHFIGKNPRQQIVNCDFNRNGCGTQRKDKQPT